MTWYSKEKQIEIHNLRLHKRIGPKPNANSHIKIYPMKMDYSQVGFSFKEKA